MITWGAWATGIVGLGIGAAIAWIIARSRRRAELARAEYDPALIPIAKSEVPKAAQPKRPEPPAPTTTETASKPQGLRYLRLRDVCERVGVGASTIYKMMATGAFPKQVKLSLRTAVWIDSEV